MAITKEEVNEFLVRVGKKLQTILEESIENEFKITSDRYIVLFEFLCNFAPNVLRFHIPPEDLKIILDQIGDHYKSWHERDKEFIPFKPKNDIN